MDQPTWGIVSTIKAPAADILRFAAFHLRAGAHRIYVYLDDENPTAQTALKAHPKCRVIRCDAAYWQKHGNRPKKHQVRQSVNATHAYQRRAEVDWLIHMDVDEFLVSDQPIATILSGLPADRLTARIRPMEVLAGDGTAFKAFIPNGPERKAITQALYPTFGAYLKGGFLSHLAGKLFVRSRLDSIRLQIHNAFEGGMALPDSAQLHGIDLAHCHAKSWDQWLADYRYRHEKGSYRADLAPNASPEKGGMTLHALFEMIEQQDGVHGLRAFFDEVVADTPDLRARLAERGLLRQIDLDFAQALATHFPNVTL